MIGLERFNTVAEGLDHPEGVTIGPDGMLYAGGEAGQVYRVAVDGTVEELASTGGFLYGVTVDGDSHIYACDLGNASVMRVSRDGEVSTYSSGTPERPMRVPNASAFDRDGNLFVTDSGEWGADDGVVYRVSREGATVVWTDAIGGFPNGCAISLEDDALLVVESRARRVVRIPFEDDGSAGAPVDVADLSGSQPDGVAVGGDGSLFVGCYRPDRVWRVDPDGAAEVWAEDEDGVILNQPANVVFTGERLDRIVVSSLGGWSLVVADAGVDGQPLRYPRL